MNLNNTTLRWIMIVVRFKDIMRHPNLIFFMETGMFLEEKNILLNNKGYVVLGTIEFEEHFEKNAKFDIPGTFETVKKYLCNQTKNNSAECHFGTTGSIFSFGYGSRYSKNPATQQSIDRFANIEYYMNFFYHTFKFNCFTKLFTFRMKQKQNLKRFLWQNKTFRS